MHIRSPMLSTRLLHKLRWTTLGLQFDWNRRAYDSSLPHAPFPEYLANLAEKLAAPALEEGSQFSAEAAIVNFYHEGDTLGGHVDDMENDWTKPIVSISLGCDAIFLLGGETKAVDPLPLLLRSGDVVLMAGPCRRCFHGVPRVLTERNLLSPCLHGSSSPCGHKICDLTKRMRININIRQVN